MQNLTHANAPARLRFLAILLLLAFATRLSPAATRVLSRVGEARSIGAQPASPPVASPFGEWMPRSDGAWFPACALGPH